MDTKAAIKRTLTRLQKLVVQYYDENPDILDNRKGTSDWVSYYGSAIVGIVYNKYTDKWQNVARITLKGDDYKTYFDVCSPIDGKPIEHASIKEEVNMRYKRISENKYKRCFSVSAGVLLMVLILTILIVLGAVL